MHQPSALLRLLALAAIVAVPSCSERVETADPVVAAADPIESSGAAPPSSTVEPVVQEILAQLDDPAGAPGRRLTLARYTIASGATMAPHFHPGVQMASVVSGTLTYNVVSG